MLTLTALKDLSRDPKFIELAADCVAWQALAESTRERVDRYVRIVFDAFTFKVSDRMAARRGDAGARITDPKELCLCEDEVLLKEYYSMCDKAHRMAGYDMPTGYCPALVSGLAHDDAEHALLAYADSKLGTPFAETYLESRKKAVDLVLGMALQNPETERLAQARFPRTCVEAYARISAAAHRPEPTPEPVPVAA